MQLRGKGRLHLTEAKRNKPGIDEARREIFTQEPGFLFGKYSWEGFHFASKS